VAVNRTKVLEAAQKFLSKGQYDKAIAEYQKLVNEDPRDVRTLLKIGDLHTKRNKPKDAIEVYEKVAELYAKQGFFLKAVAVYKQILKLDAGHLSSSQKLAKMYEELALTSDALNTYEQVADAYLSQGQIDKALETMERMVELDGTNVAARIKYAEALSKANKPKEAAAAFAEGAHLLKEQGRMDDYIRVVERQLFHDADNLSLSRELSGLYLERQDPKRALAKLQLCFKADPRDAQTLEMLAEAFRQLGQLPKTISVLKEIARLHAELGNQEPRLRTLKRILDLDPNDQEVLQALSAAGLGAAPRTAGGAAAPAKPAPAAAPQARPPQATLRGPVPPAPAPRAASSLPPVPEPEEVELEVDSSSEFEVNLEESGEAVLADSTDDDEVLIIDDHTGRHPEPERANLQPEAVQTARHPESRQDRIKRLLADADAHEGYGLLDKVETLLRQVLEDDPSNVTAHERLKDLYLATDRRVDAARELLWLSESLTNTNRERAEQLARTAYDLAPHAAATKARLAALGLATDTKAAPAEREAESPGSYGTSKAEQSTTQALERLGGPRQAVAPIDRVARTTHADARPAAAMPRRTLADDKPQPRGPATEDPLDIPMSPDEFDAPPPRPSRTLDMAQLRSLLEVEVSFREFEEAPLATEPDLGPNVQADAFDEPEAPEAPEDMSALLDAPISPDEFDAAPPSREILHAPEDGLSDLLDRPLPPDDFGLSDERFDRSGLIDVDSTELGDAAEIRAAVADQAKLPSERAVSASYDDSPSIEFADVGTGELDLDELEAAEAAAARPAVARVDARDEFTELGTGELVFDQEAYEAAARTKPPPAAAPPAPASGAEDGPDATVPGGPIPDLLARTRAPKPEAPQAPADDELLFVMPESVPPKPSAGEDDALLFVEPEPEAAKPSSAQDDELLLLEPSSAEPITAQGDELLFVKPSVELSEPGPKAALAASAPPAPPKVPPAPPPPALAKPAPAPQAPAPQPAKPAPAPQPAQPAPAPQPAQPAPAPQPAKPAPAPQPAQPAPAPQPAKPGPAPQPAKPAPAPQPAKPAPAPQPAKPAPAPVLAKPAPAPPPVEEPEDVPPEVEETIDEADFFASQGMMDEALELVQEAILIYPGSKALRAKLLEYEAAADEKEALEEQKAAAPQEDESFDIAESLAVSLEEPPGGAHEEMVDVESVFAQFKKGVSEQIGIEDSATHFDLGIAYKEMGLLDDAMQEFEIASRSPARACTALTMIGLCAIEKGDAQRAVSEFERALATPQKTSGEELALQYELGAAYELVGRSDAALDAFSKVFARDRAFRDVARRLEALKNRKGPSIESEDEVDAALDDLLGGG
jgi:tetratricopeptide (TPR) repeat protein